MKRRIRNVNVGLDSFLNTYENDLGEHWFNIVEGL